MSLYLDASVLVALIAPDIHNQRATKLLRSNDTVIQASDFGCAECASSLARRVRMGQTSVTTARDAVRVLDAWIANCAERVNLVSMDIANADFHVRRFDMPLRTPDAIHIAIAQRLGARLATFDAKLADCARTLGLVVVTD